jgi:hypothetical protein
MQQTRTFINFLLPGFDPKSISQTAPVQSQSGDGRSTVPRKGVRFPETGVR